MQSGSYLLSFLLDHRGGGWDMTRILTRMESAQLEKSPRCEKPPTVDCYQNQATGGNLHGL